MCEPFRQRKILIEAALEHLQKLEVGVARILHVVGQCLEHIANVSSLKVHGAGAASGSEHGHPSGTADVVLPFVGIGMPVQFAYPSRMNRDYGGCNRGGYFERARIDDPHLASLGALRERLL